MTGTTYVLLKSINGIVQITKMSLRTFPQISQKSDNIVEESTNHNFLTQQLHEFNKNLPK